MEDNSKISIVDVFKERLARNDIEAINYHDIRLFTISEQPEAIAFYQMRIMDGLELEGKVDDYDWDEITKYFDEGNILMDIDEVITGLIAEVMKEKGKPTSDDQRIFLLNDVEYCEFLNHYVTYVDSDTPYITLCKMLGEEI